ncbi:MAG TPA: hypothetical protein VMW50_03540 [Dehalococcoidia bacterium]|nr:hypothetical protein [Dehalococcoidia bacterium]
MRKSKKSKFPDMDRSPEVRRGKEMGFLNFQPLHVNRWQWSDQVIFWTWRDAQREFFESKRRTVRGKRLIVLTGLAIVIGSIIWMVI